MEHKFVELTMSDNTVLLLNLDHVISCTKNEDASCDLVMSYLDEDKANVVLHPVFPYAHMKLFLAPNLK